MYGTQNYGFTSAEMKYLPVRPIQRRRNKLVSKKQFVVALVLAGLFLAAFAVDMLHLTQSRIGAEVAHAEVIHQNDYYCEQIKNGSMRLKEENPALKSLCAKWGVAL